MVRFTAEPAEPVTFTVVAEFFADVPARVLPFTKSALPVPAVAVSGPDIFSKGGIRHGLREGRPIENVAARGYLGAVSNINDRPAWRLTGKPFSGGGGISKSGGRRLPVCAACSREVK